MGPSDSCEVGIDFLHLKYPSLLERMEPVHIRSFEGSVRFPAAAFPLLEHEHLVAESCPAPKCEYMVRKLAQLEPAQPYGPYLRGRIAMVNTLPPYTIERYVRVLNLWRQRGRTLRTLVDLCLRCLDPALLEDRSLLLPRRNYVIHRVFKRMLSIAVEAARYESINSSGRIFQQYGFANQNLLVGWLNRGKYLRVVRCPFHRLDSRLAFESRCIDSVVIDDTFLDESVNYFASPHQCGYIRCTCFEYKEIQEAPPNWRQSDPTSTLDPQGKEEGTQGQAPSRASGSTRSNQKRR